MFLLNDCIFDKFDAQRATLVDMAISSNNCIIASWWIMLKITASTFVFLSYNCVGE